MKRFACFLLILLSFVFTIKAEGEKARILQNCEKLFGKTLDEKLNLYEINQLFILKPEFNEKEVLVKISVRPKHSYREEHPEWEKLNDDPLFSKVEYHEVLGKINSIKSLGILLRESLFSPITNMTNHAYQYYANAHLERSELFSGIAWENVRLIYVDFFQVVEGKIKKKKSCSFCSGVQFLVNTGEASFYVEKETYRNLKKGKTATFRGVSAGNVNVDNFGKKLKFKFKKTKKD